MAFSINVYNAATAPDEQLRFIHEIYIEREFDFMPDDPLTPFAHAAAFWRAPTGSYRNDTRWSAIEDGRIVGYGHTATWEDHQNTGLVTVAVRRADRQRGVGAALLAAAIDQLESEGRSKLIIDAPQGSPLTQSLERLGLAAALGERISRLSVPDVDWQLMDSWIDRAPARASDYDLAFIDDRVPDDYLERWCRTEEAMNTAPLEDLDLDDEIMTPEKWRSIEATAAARGMRLRSAVAIHRPTGEFAGLTTIYALDHHPTTAEQDDTVVDPAHRGKGLGRWLKAANLKRFVAEFPDAEYIYTGNADSNEPMLNINVAMGFVPAAMFTAWQGTVADARAHLE